LSIERKKAVRLATRFSFQPIDFGIAKESVGLLSPRLRTRALLPGMM